ncbi:hypothetical protein C8A06_0060 [Microbacteriaceae bacterium MWH-Ta3]|nr:hypothetical protein C8A06_0060 [Microbacteriaceae bacterium MWH-Ta3]
MSLSEEDRRVLDEMERQLTSGTADVVSTSERRAPNLRLVIVGVIALVAGIGVLVLGVMITQPLVGVAGFAVMVVGASLMANRRGPAVGKAAAPRSTMYDNLEKRWDRRTNGDA